MISRKKQNLKYKKKMSRKELRASVAWMTKLAKECGLIGNFTPSEFSRAVGNKFSEGLLKGLKGED